jgi:signal transduction histidine kinase
MTQHSFSSLRTRLLFLVLLAVLPAVGLTLYTAWEQRREAALAAQREALRLAEIVSANHERLIEGARQLLAGLARLPEVRRRDARACSPLFADLLKQYPGYANLGAIEPNGTLFCSALPSSRPVNVSDRAYVRRALETRTFAVGEYQVGRVTGKATVNFGHPVLDEAGRVQAVVFAALDLAWLNELASRARLPQGSTLTVIDRTGAILARHPDSTKWVGKSAPEASIVKTVLAQGEGTAQSAGEDGIPRLFGFTPLRGAPQAGAVYVSIGIPERVAYAQANRALANNLIGLGVVVVVVLIGTYLFAGRFILRPVDRMVSATRGLAAGDLSVRTGLPHEQGELSQLARAFDEMAESLERQRDALIKSEKMAALGRLAAGVAHELRNPLMIIDGRVQLLRKPLAQGQLPPVDLLSRYVASLGEAATRMRGIMEGLSAYSKPRKPEPALLDVGELLSATRELVAGQAKKSEVMISVDVPSTLPKVQVDRSQLTQVFVNLATNAIEAMDGTGGQLTLKARVDGEGSERRVRVEVSDTGPGIRPEVLPKIWEVFYTSKPEGTGLGLSIVRGLVAEQPGATIDVESVAGQGTTFTLTMLVAGAPRPTDPSGRPAIEPAKG